MKGIRHGKGVYRFDDGTTYIGNWVHGKKHGQGRLEMASGEVYDGEWKDDKMHGYGVHLFPDGATFEGQYIDGKWTCLKFFTNDEYGYMRKEILAKSEQWTPLNEGERTDYECQYKVKQGWFDGNDPKLKELLN